MSYIKTTTGENTITFDAYYQYIWARNYGDTDVYISNHNNIVAGDDDVVLLPAGEAVRLTVNGKTLYVLGSTTLEVHAQNFSDAPFEGGSGGGGSITIDPTPTQGSSNAVSSGGVYTALQNVPQTVDYSTTEQNTGRKWIDGKPIYQISTLVSGNDIFDANTLSIDKLIKVEAFGSDGNGYTSNKWTIEGVSASANRLIYWNSSSGKIVYDGTFPLYTATIWYTKTTDTVG